VVQAAVKTVLEQMFPQQIRDNLSNLSDVKKQMQTIQQLLTNSLVLTNGLLIGLAVVVLLAMAAFVIYKTCCRPVSVQDSSYVSMSHA